MTSSTAAKFRSIKPGEAVRVPCRATLAHTSGGKDDRNPDVAADPWRIERNRVAVPAHLQIDAGGAKREIAEDHFVAKRRQLRIEQPDFAVERIELQAERGFQEGEGRGAGPGLRRAGHRIERRTVTALAAKAAEQFGQP